MVSDISEEKLDMIALTPESIHRYLDSQIKKWRAIKNNPNRPDGDSAIHYIKAFQSIHNALFGCDVDKK